MSAVTSEDKSSWSLLNITPEARDAAERAAADAGMKLDDWLAQLVKYTTTMQAHSDAGGAEIRAKQPASADVTPKPVAPSPPSAAPPPLPPKPAVTTAEAKPAAPSAWPSTPATPSPPAASASTASAPSGPVPLARVFPSSMRAAPREVPPPAAAARGGEPTPALPPVAARPEPKAEIKTGPAAPLVIATEQLFPSRFAALASPSEDEILAALEKWRSTSMLEPLLVRPKSGQPGAFEIISGIERWHAARRAFVRSMPAIVRDATDQETLEIGIVDQLRRGPLSALAEATLYLRLVNDAGLDAERIAKLVAKPAAHVAVMLRILELPRPVRAMIESGELGILHARALLTAPDPEALARDVVAKRLDIFQTEQLVRVASRNAGAEPAPTAPQKSAVAPEKAAPGAEKTAAAPDKPAVPDKTAAAPASPAAPQPAPPAPQPSPPQPSPPPAVETAPREAESADRPRIAADPRPANVVSTDLLERKVAQTLGVKCMISEQGGIGAITIHYANREELARVLARLNIGQAVSK